MKDDKRELDEAMSYISFSYIAHGDVDGTFVYSLYSVLFDAGYVGSRRYWPTAMVKQGRPAGALAQDWLRFDFRLSVHASPVVSSECSGFSMIIAFASRGTSWMMLSPCAYLS